MGVLPVEQIGGEAPVVHGNLMGLQQANETTGMRGQGAERRRRDHGAQPLVDGVLLIPFT